jgi:hypothetical protein
VAGAEDVQRRGASGDSVEDERAVLPGGDTRGPSGVGDDLRVVRDPVDGPDEASAQRGARTQRDAQRSVADVRGGELRLLSEDTRRLDAQPEPAVGCDPERGG